MRSIKYRILSFFHSFILFILFISFISFISSCTAPIEIETDDSEPVIVVYGTLTDEVRQQEVRISRSSPYFDNEPNAAVSGAIVTIISSQNEIYSLIENAERPGLYQTREAWAVKDGITYSLHIEVDFDSDGVLDRYDASSTVYPQAQLDSIRIEPMEIMGHKNYALNIYGTDGPDHEYYMFKVLVNDSLISSKISEIYTFDDVAFNNVYIDGLTLDYFDDISEYEIDSDERRKRSTYLSPGDRMTLQMSIVPKGYHDFLNQCRSEMNGENPFFGGPASNIETNISGGGVGFFVAYRIVSATNYVPASGKSF